MQAFDPVEVIDRIAPRPLLLIHGVEDEIIPVASAHVLYRRAGEPKELWLMDGLKHCQALDEAYEPFQERVRRRSSTSLAQRADAVAFESDEAARASVAG